MWSPQLKEFPFCNFPKERKKAAALANSFYNFSKLNFQWNLKKMKGNFLDFFRVVILTFLMEEEDTGGPYQGSG